ncbi:vacuolar fusion protein CCZ1 homolog B-like isoform X2 [Silene latifolia]|uniref:vacuolar fusion protein CCZ1 homolog B-like isoform X2 n=1 Tax=Silene latifolia TaxID=37657 RepID=UPI003D78A421
MSRELKMIFSPDAVCEVIEAERHSHVFYEAEPDIWMVMIVEKNRELEGIWRIDALRSMLKEVHSLFVMFNGSVREMLDKDSSGALLHPLLYSFITDNLYDLISGKKLQLPSFRDSLKERGTVQMLTVSREAALEVQSLVRVLGSCLRNVRCHSMVLFHDLLVSTSLFPDDTVNLYTYAVMRMSPRALSSSSSSWSYLRKGSTAPHSSQGSRDTSSSGDNRKPILRPLQLGKWSKGKDNFLVADPWGSEIDVENSSIPTIWLQQTNERVYLCAYQQKNVTIILLIPATSINNAQRDIPLVKHQLLEDASLKILKVEEKLSKGWGGENAYHVGGYRYLLVDGDRSVSRASPTSKVATLAKESLVAMCKLREEVDLEKSRVQGDEGNNEKDLEVCIRAKNNAWVVARVTRGKELYVVLEKADETLLNASDAVEKFSHRYCNGAFSLD